MFHSDRRLYRVYSCCIVNQNRWKDTIYVPQPNSLNSIQMNQEYYTIQNLQQKSLPFFFFQHPDFSLVLYCPVLFPMVQEICLLVFFVYYTVYITTEPCIDSTVQLSTENNKKQNLFLVLLSEVL